MCQCLQTTLAQRIHPLHLILLRERASLVCPIAEQSHLRLLLPLHLLLHLHLLLLLREEDELGSEKGIPSRQQVKHGALCRQLNALNDLGRARRHLRGAWECHLHLSQQFQFRPVVGCCVCHPSFSCFFCSFSCSSSM